MPAKYVWRLDDITNGMNLARFWQWMELFKKHAVIPLLGIVPDNRDGQLIVEKRSSEFWIMIRKLREAGQVEIAQHGFQHISAEQGWRCRERDWSEFAGLPYEQQAEKIRRGRDILADQGLDSDVWMPPNHSFDGVTLRALCDQSFGAVTDGISLYPYKQNGLTFVPQQLWRPRSLPFGIMTICLHTNELPETALREAERFLKSGSRSICFSEARAYRPFPGESCLDKAFKIAYYTAKAGRGVVLSRS